MKIVIDDQYQNDENKQYTVDENGNVNLFISVGDEVGNESTINEDVNVNSNNIEYNEKEKFIENDLDEFQENIVVENNGVEEGNLIGSEVEDNIVDSSTINTENPWEEEKFSRNYHSIYAEIENNLEEKYSSNNKLEENYVANDSVEEEYTDTSNKESNKKINNEYFSENEANNFYNEKRESSNKEVIEERGTIEVFSKLGGKEGVELKGARINLYLLNGVSPKLYDSKFTDSLGKVTFDNLPNACYRIISIVDRRFFEKPIYYNWNEVIIDKNNKNSTVLVVNKIKAAYYRR
ncbi:calcium-binding protein [Clostridium nigeriense]|uniref:calcium-binding protein n=1 Tax=Clostridium nigeriense TaxID=1805470 RepID=UPI003D342631